MVMKYIRLIFREIKSSKARFFAIAAIFALGVGFYSGLGSTMPVMKKSMDSYAGSYNLYDIKLLSEYGFEGSDLDSILSVENVANAVPSKSADVLTDGTALRLMSLTDGINGVRLLEGRMPQNPGECVLGRNKMSGNLALIGETITLSDENDKDTLSMFKTRSFTVVGIAESPVFPSVQRGAASVGQGALHHYAYIAESDFDTDYYTEVYAVLDGAENLQLYTQEYEELAMNAADALENSPLAGVQLERVRAKAQTELEKARAEYESEKSDALKELSDAKRELDDAKAELDSANERISDGERDLERGKAELEQARYESESMLEAAQMELEEKSSQYESGKAELDKTYAYLLSAYGKDAADAQTVSARAQLEAAKTALDAGRAELDVSRERAERELNAALAEIAENESELASARAEYQSGLQKYQSGLEEYNAQSQKAEAELADAEAELESAQADIDALEPPEIYVTTLKDNYGVNAFSQDAQRIDNIARVFPIIFFVVAALVCLTTMTRMIDEQRTKIGTLSALGYGRGAIAAQYLSYSCIAAVFGGIIGILLGNTAIPVVIFNTYKILYSLPNVVLTVDFPKALLAFGASLVLTVAVTLWAALDSLRAPAAQLMRPAAPKSGKKVILERVGFLWRRMSFTSKVTCRNILRYKKRFFMTVLGIGGCCALLLTGFGLKDSISGMIPRQYGKIQNFDMTVYLSDDNDEARAAVYDNSDDCIFVQSTSSDAKSGSENLECYIFVPEKPERLSEYISFHERKSGKAVEFPGYGQAVIAEKLSSRLNIGIGDKISVKRTEGDYVELTVSGITENYIYNYVYMSPKTYEDMFEKPPEYNQAYVKAADPKTAGENMSVNDDVVSVMNSQDMMDSFSDVFDSLNGVVWLLIVSACLLNFVVLYNLTNINIGERVREIATIKVLGFYPRETDAYIYRENIVLTAVGTALGLWLGVFLHRFVISAAEIDMIMFTRNINVLSFIMSAVLTFVFSALVNFFMHFKLTRISMTESLKSIE